MSANDKPSSRGEDYRIRDTQKQVDEVVGIMRNNVEKVLERDQKLNDLEDKSDALRDGAARFETTSRKLKRKMWWKNLKFMGILILVIIVVIVLIVVISQPWKNGR